MEVTNSGDRTPAASGFSTTHWSLITRAATPSPEGRAALEALCRAYWFPVYAFARKQGCMASDAEDVTQDFFAEIVQSEFLQRADPQRGRFRSYLFTAVKRRILNAHERWSARFQPAPTRPLSGARKAAPVWRSWKPTTFPEGGSCAPHAMFIICGFAALFGIERRSARSTFSCHRAPVVDPAQKQELEDTGLQPSDPKETAVVATIPPGPYTAQVRGKPETTGIGVVQVYFLE